jgi:hypothetical protein
MRKVARKNLAVLGTLFTAAGAVVIVAIGWAFLDSHSYFCPAIRRSRCLQNLEAIRAAKIEMRQELQLADDASMSRDDLAPRLPKGFKNLECPAGGIYDVGVAGAVPRCSVPDHQPTPK